MPSHLRQSTSIDDLPPTTPAPAAGPVRRTSSRSSSSSSTDSLRRKMSITQTYFLAHTARGKLSSEAARSDHDLRLLVGHANLLDSLTLDLQEAEREQDAWFERTVAEARKPSEPKRVQWTDRPASVSVQDLEIPDGEDEEDSDADSDADSDDEAVYAEADAVTMTSPSRRAKSPPPMIIDADSEEDEDEDMYDDEEVDNADLSLTRVASRPTFASISPPPELVPDHSDSSSDEEDESESDEEEDLSPAAAPSLSLPIQPVIAPKDFSHPSSQPHGFLEQRQAPAVAAY